MAGRLRDDAQRADMSAMTASDTLRPDASTGHA